MKILIAAGNFPPDVGGPATYVPAMAAALTRKGHHITVYTRSKGSGIADKFPFQVVRERSGVGRLRNVRLTLKALVELGRDADVLYLNCLDFEGAVAASILGKPSVQKVVGDFAWERARSWGWTGSGFDEFQANGRGIRVRGLKALRCWWSRKARKVIVPSRYLGNVVAGWGVPRKRIVVIHNAPGPIPDAGPVELPIRTPVRAIAGGRLVAHKRVDILIQAATALPSLGVIVLGDGPERGNLEALTRALGLEDRVRFTGSLTPAETRAYLAAGDLFVLNSTYEGLPHIVLEALTAGIPVLATSAGGTPEAVEDGVNGRLVPVSDDRAFREALAELVASASRRASLSAGARTSAARFGFDRMIELTESCLEAAARPAGSG